MTQPTARINRLRESCLQKNVPGFRSDEGELLWLKSWHKHVGETVLVRRAFAKADQLRFSTPVIDEDELIVGKPCYRELSDNEARMLAEARRAFGENVLRTDGQGAHMAIDYEKLLSRGVEGIRSEAKERLSETPPQDAEKAEFYRAALTALDGLLDYEQRYAAFAAKKAEVETEPVRKAELLKIAATLQKVPREPAESFREALQSVHFVNFCLEGLYQLGRPDRYLLPFFEKDRREGKLTDESALELIDCVCILFNEYVNKGLAIGFMVGGRDENGRDICNDLTALFLQSIRHTHLIYPGIGFCVNADTPRELLFLSAELLTEGLSHPAIFNDDLIIQSLRSVGLPASEACLYTHSTCVEITPIASSAVWVASDYINLIQILLDMLGIPPLGDSNPGEAMTFSDFDGLLAEYRRRLREKVAANAAIQNRRQMERFHHGGDPLVSCFVNDCLLRGRDIDRGGARYNWIEPSFVGLSNLCDSLSVLRTLVFEQKVCTLAEFSDALKKNFEGSEKLFETIKNKIPKYGNDNDEADALLPVVTSWITDAVSKDRTYRGDRFIPSLFCWVMHEHFGTETAASPDGRKAGFPLGDGSGPAQGRENEGPTASILSSTKWNHAPFLGGVAVNLKFSKASLGEHSAENLASLIRVYLSRGGFEVQVNTVDRETLLCAQKEPENYRDLVVRVGGYSDYFTNLSPAMQAEVLARTAHTV